MAERTCFNCVYCICDPCLWLRWLREGESIVPQCANHPQWPGRLHDVPGVPCPHYHPKPEPPQGDGVRMIPMSDAGYVYVDTADYEWLNQWHWHLNNGYAARRDKKHKVIFMHHLLLPPRPGMVVDHVDGHKANNCRTNLRHATRTQNMLNRRKPSGSFSSRFKGVYYHRRVRKWYARCRYKGRYHKRAYFDTEIEAAQAYDHLAVAWFGEFARLNFPREWPPERRAQVYADNAKQREEADRTEAKRKRAKARREKAKGKKKNGKGHRETAKVTRKKVKSKRGTPRRGE